MNQNEWILKIVSSFYDKAKNDILIGYHFRNISDFETHIPRIASFWEIQLLGQTDKIISPPFNILAAHLPLNIKRGELGRWLVLFRKTLDEEINLPTDLKEDWLEKLLSFEGIFLRTFGL
jgi:truncated hemoglobin YjbI